MDQSLCCKKYRFSSKNSPSTGVENGLEHILPPTHQLTHDRPRQIEPSASPLTTRTHRGKTKFGEIFGTEELRLRVESA